MTNLVKTYPSKSHPSRLLLANFKNEENPQAIDFYEKMGFRKTGRSQKDGSGKDYPLIHMSL
ncbi:GNAT family N-acetyltransferase [Chryseobacterium scophthalmum]|uniref:GNAT family N-acetyltransferase n=1 Tax=Chryseobacterium scophthalmum TaxID=59733 RepID=UPI001FDA4FEC|nr:GNAT family N-acetyltransferase [Chryseobacterium scophthalmum]